MSIVLFVLRKLILQTRMRSHSVGLDVWCLVGSFFYFHTLCVGAAKALARLRWCAGLPEPSLDACVISTIISWAGSNNFILFRDIIRQCANCGKDDVVIFSGSGATAGLHKVAWGLKINMPRVAEETVRLLEKTNLTRKYSYLLYFWLFTFKILDEKMKKTHFWHE